MNKKRIGATERLFVSEAQLSFLARIDTGSMLSSIHAFDVRFKDNQSLIKENNIGKTISFKTENDQGEVASIEAVITDIPLIKSPQGTEERYIVELRIGNHQDKVEVTLKNRSHMEYKLLIGRNWLQGKYIVDVDLMTRNE